MKFTKTLVFDNRGGHAENMRREKFILQLPPEPDLASRALRRMNIPALDHLGRVEAQLPMDRSK